MTKMKQTFESYDWVWDESKIREPLSKRMRVSDGSMGSSRRENLETYIKTITNIPWTWLQRTTSDERVKKIERLDSRSLPRVESVETWSRGESGWHLLHLLFSRHRAIRSSVDTTALVVGISFKKDFAVAELFRTISNDPTLLRLPEWWGSINYLHRISLDKKNLNSFIKWVVHYKLSLRNGFSVWMYEQRNVGSGVLRTNSFIAEMVLKTATFATETLWAMPERLT